MNRRAWAIVGICAAAILGAVYLMQKKFRSRRDFLFALRPDALKLQALTGISYLITLGHASEESGDGSNTLTAQARNIFSIKAGSSWKGPTFKLPADGQLYRSYPTFYDAMLDWASLLGRLYPEALAAAKAGNAAAYARALQRGKAGAYAEDPNYLAKIASRIHAVKEALA